MSRSNPAAHPPLGDSLRDARDYGYIFFGSTPGFHFAGSDELLMYTAMTGSAQSPNSLQVRLPVIPLKFFVANRASRSAFRPMYRLPCASFFPTFSMAVKIIIV